MSNNINNTNIKNNININFDNVNLDDVKELETLNTQFTNEETIEILKQIKNNLEYELNDVKSEIETLYNKLIEKFMTLNT